MLFDIPNIMFATQLMFFNSLHIRKIDMFFRDRERGGRENKQYELYPCSSFTGSVLTPCGGKQRGNSC